MNAALDLTPEWQRVEVLATCLSNLRRGEGLTDELTARLRAIQAEVHVVRETSRWQRLQHHGINALDQDILACILAPDAEPRLAWFYQDLQPGVASPYPTPALVRELLFVDQQDMPAFLARFDHQAPLRRLKLIESVDSIHQPLRPTQRLRGTLLGWSLNESQLPGALELPVRAGWDDIVLSSSCRQAIEELVAWVQHQPRIEHEWGARVSGGPIALFSGPSGTGKTLAAEVVANLIGCRLFRVDLGRLVSKYVGETEKNLNQLLDAVENDPILLLFDEADSLFGRRGDIKDARDRYANMEVSHLLTRIELHRGPCILTTNLRQHLDVGFLRRFHAVIEFSRPDAEARSAIWQLHLPPRAPRAADVNPKRLGHALTLSGGQIRNAALRAAVLASSQGQPITLTHVARAVKAELAKDGSEVTSTALGFLSSALTEESP